MTAAGVYHFIEGLIHFCAYMTASLFPLSAEYSTGRTYFYKYVAQILTGNPEMSKQYSGYQMRCTVRVVMRPNRRVHMRLENIAFQQTNRILPVPTSRLTVVLPTNYFEKLTNSQDYRLIVRMLRLPVSFLWTRSGWVKEIQVSNSDIDWSLNLKKALMTMLNFNMRIKPSAINRSRNGIFMRTKYFEVKRYSFFILLRTSRAHRPSRPSFPPFPPRTASTDIARPTTNTACIPTQFASGIVR